jgi:hypothetical protein
MHVVADEEIGKVRSGNPLDVRESVAFRRAVEPASGYQADENASIWIGVKGDVLALAAVDRVGPGAAHDVVIAAEPEDRIRSAVSVDRVGVIGHPIGGVEGLGIIMSVNGCHGAALSQPKPSSGAGRKGGRVTWLVARPGLRVHAVVAAERQLCAARHCALPFGRDSGDWGDVVHRR